MSKPTSQFLFKTVVVRFNSLSPIQNPNVGSIRLRRFSTSSDSEDEKEASFVVSYLIESLGFSPKIAISASKSVNFDSHDKPDNAIEFLRAFGFGQSQISKLVRGFPGVLTSNVGKTILPKLEFLKTKGVSKPEMAKILSSYPGFLRTSLSDRIVPSYDYLRHLFQSDEKTICAVKKYPDILGHNLKYVESNVEILRKLGMPDSKIAPVLQYQPRAFVIRSERFQEAVDEVAKMGFDASTVAFTTAVAVCLGMTKSTWESKVNAYKKCGFSEEEVARAFLRQPFTMACSEEKIYAIMSYLINEMSLSPSLIAAVPVVLTMSLKKRIVPRCSVFKVLVSKGLVNKEVNLSQLLKVSEDKFLNKFVKHYEKDAPDLLELYQRKLSR